jgi:hypothetical protein
MGPPAIAIFGVQVVICGIRFFGASRVAAKENLNKCLISFSAGCSNTYRATQDNQSCDNQIRVVLPEQFMTVIRASGIAFIADGAG